MEYRGFFRVSGLTFMVVTILGCANSASHKVVKTEQIGDQELSCSQLRTEKRKVEVIIRGVEQDKADMTGADVVDGLLWFPFNVIAKQSNYSNATKAAEDRIEYLTSLEIEHGCTAEGISAVTQAGDTKASQQLQQLNSLYKSGVLSQDEYIEKRTKILDSIVPETAAASGVTSQKRLGQYSHKIESMAKDRNCQVVGFAELLSKTGSIEVYQVNCKGSEPLLARCEYQDCGFVN